MKEKRKKKLRAYVALLLLFTMVFYSGTMAFADGSSNQPAEQAEAQPAVDETTEGQVEAPASDENKTDESTVDDNESTIEKNLDEKVDADEGALFISKLNSEAKAASSNVTTANKNVLTVVCKDLQGNYIGTKNIELDDEFEDIESYDLQIAGYEFASAKINGTERYSLRYEKYRGEYKYYYSTFLSERSFDVSKLVFYYNSNIVTNVAITGDSSVEQFGSINLSASKTPSNAVTTLSWSSSDTGILTVNNNGKVTGVKQGKATVTLTAQNSDGTTVSASKEITVVKSTKKESAQFYYLKTPTSDPASNDSDNWGATIGDGSVNVVGATWSGDKNLFVTDGDRVISWPKGFENGVVSTSSSHWTTIFNAFKKSLPEADRNITADDVEAIILHPYKISKGNGTTPDKHVDCTVEIKVKNIYTATYYLSDAGSSDFVWKFAENVRKGHTTMPNSELSNLPMTKEVNGRIYKFIGWYDNANLSGTAVTFPYTMTTNTNFYAKYSEKYFVNYELNGGKWNQSTTRYAFDEGETVKVLNAVPTKAGYTFAGWSAEDGTVYEGGNSFVMPSGDVTLTAKWTANKYTVTYTKGEHGTFADDVHSDVAYDAATPAYSGETPTDDNYYFTGWNPEISEKVSGNVTYVAQWAEKAELTLTATNDTKTYNGVQQSIDGNAFTSSGLALRYEGVSVVGSGTDAGNYATSVQIGENFKIFDINNNDVTNKYKVNTVGGNLTINPATLTVTTNSDEKVYDGEPLTSGGTISGFVNGETAVLTTTGTQTNVGTSYNTYKIDWGTVKDSNYTVNETIGKLTVKQYASEIVVTTTGGEYTYDGTAHGATVEVGKLPKGYTVETATSNATATDVTAKDVKATVDNLVIRNSAGEDVTSSLNIKKVDGSIKINPATLTVTTPGASKTYDGTALTAAGSMSGLVNEETAVLTTTGTQTAVGDSKNTYKIDWGTAKESNYTVNETVGKLTVNENKEEITVTTTGGEFTYDGKAHGATVKVSTLPKGYTLETATSNATATDVTNTAISAKADNLVIKNSAGEDVTSKLNIKYTDGSIVVTPATLTVKTNSDEKVYDGEPLTAEGTITGFVNGETAVFKTTGTQTTVGTSDNTYDIGWTGTAKKSNYTVNETIGKLTVKENASEIVVTTTGGEYTYDGKAHGATVNVSTLPKGYTVETATSNATATDVTTSDVAATVDNLVIKNKNGDDVTGDLNIKKVDGSIKINPATLTVTTPDASKTYDGTALTAAGSMSGLVNEETAVLTTTGTQTDVGTSENTYNIDWTGTAKESNYTVAETVGTLTVNENEEEITVKTTGGEFTYDGTAHGATVEVSDLPTGYTLETATSNATATDVTKTAISAKADNLVIKNTAGEDVTSKLNIKYTDGSIKINPATLTVETPNDQKVYDGEPLTAEGTISGFVNGETVVFTTTGTQTDVGTSDNTYDIGWTGTAKKSNYTVNATVGKLTVKENASEIVVTTTGGEYTYDGKEHGATVDVSALPKGYTLKTATSNATATDVTAKDVKATVDNLVIENAKGEDVTSSLNIKKVDGSIKINPATLTVVTPSAEKVYDGESLTAEGTISGFVNEETAVFTTTGTQTDV